MSHQPTSLSQLSTEGLKNIDLAALREAESYSQIVERVVMLSLV